MQQKHSLKRVILKSKALLLALVLFLHVESFLSADELIKRTKVMMGTYVSVSLEKEDLYLSNDIFKRLKKVELALSSYDKNAQIYKLNHNKKTLISKDTYEALSLSKKFYEKTDGYFDITIGSITKNLFHFGEDSKVPSSKELSLAKISLKGLHFDKKEAYIEDKIVIDLGGMGKGFAVDKSIELLKTHNIKKAIVALSGDIYCLYECQMSVQNPFDEKVLAEFILKDMAISTSGNYRRYVKNKKNNHLINPKKRKSQKTFASITLISKTLSNASLDAFATAACVMPFKKSMSFLDKQKELAYLVVTNKKDIYINEKFRSLVDNFKLYKLEDSRQRQYIIKKP